MNTVLNMKVCHQMTDKLIFINQFFVNICVIYSTLTQKKLTHNSMFIMDEGIFNYKRTQ